MNKDTILRRGAAAKRILEDQEIMTVFGEIEAELLTDWAATNPLRPEDREAIYRQVKALELFQTKLEQWRDTVIVDNETKKRILSEQTGNSPEV